MNNNINPAEADPRPTLDREAVVTALENALPWLGRAHCDFLGAVDEIMRLAPPAEGWPEWLGPKIDPDDIEVTKTDSGYWAEGLGVARHDMTPDELRASNKVNDSISSCARREAVARFIERRESAADEEAKRIDRQVRDLAALMLDCDVRKGTPGGDAYYEVHAREIINAGWTPPESEDD